MNKFFCAMLLCFYSSHLLALETKLDESRLKQIHSELQLLHGSLKDEYHEQLMAVTFISPEATVLELGGNVGRNSCVIGKILDDSSRLVVMETIPQSAALLTENRDHNGLEFHIEAAAVSKVPLLQSGWNSFPSEEDRPGFARLRTMTFDEVQEKYGLYFDTLVADCEGALFYILRDDPELLSGIQTIVVENDYNQIEHFNFVAAEFIANGFEVVYSNKGPWGPCKGFFYQVWKKV